jgi:hypothetical protein
MSLAIVFIVLFGIEKALIEFNVFFGNSVSRVCVLMRCVVGEGWLNQLISGDVAMNGNWSLNFGVTLDILWWRRNDHVF